MPDRVPFRQVPRSELNAAMYEGLDPRIVQQVIRAVIDAFTVLAVEELEPDPS